MHLEFTQIIMWQCSWKSSQVMCNYKKLCYWYAGTKWAHWDIHCQAHDIALFSFDNLYLTISKNLPMQQHIGSKNASRFVVHWPSLMRLLNWIFNCLKLNGWRVIVLEFLSWGFCTCRFYYRWENWKDWMSLGVQGGLAMGEGKQNGT